MSKEVDHDSEGHGDSDRWSPGRFFDYFGMKRSRWVLWPLMVLMVAAVVVMSVVPEGPAAEVLNGISGLSILLGWMVALVTIYVDTRTSRRQRRSENAHRDRSN